MFRELAPSNWSSLLTVLTALVIALLSAPASGQNAGDDDDIWAGIEEMVVTSSGGVTDLLQSESTAITAFDSFELEKRGIEDLDTLAFNVPNIFIGKNGNTPVITLRGLGATSGGLRGDEAVALHVDGVFIKRPIMIQSFFDLENLDVRRGPQGTTYGKGATAGSINFVTKKPTNELSAYVDYTHGTYNTNRARANLNVPIAENLYSRFAFFYAARNGFTRIVDRDGLLDPQDRGERMDDQDDIGFRGKLRWEPADNFDVTLSGNVYLNRGHGPAIKLLGALTARQRSIRGCSPPVAPCGDPPANNRENAVNSVPDQDNEFFGGSVTANYTLDSVPLFGDVTLTAIGAYQGSRIGVRRVDQDFLDVDQVRLPYANDSHDQWSAEVRATGDTGVSNWVLGFWFFTEEGETESLLENPPFPTANRTLLFEQGVEGTQYAVYGDYSREMSETWSFRLGGRYDWAEKSGFASRANPGGGTLGSPLGRGDNDGEWSGFTGIFTLDWKPTENITFFSELSRGWKAGGLQLGLENVLNPNPPPLLLGALLEPFDPESVWSFQAGAKTDFFDGALRFNAAGFIYDYDDLQFSFSDAVIIRTDSIPDVQISGVEFEATLSGLPFPAPGTVLPNLRTNLQVSVLKTEVLRGRAVFGEPSGIVATTVTQDIKGNKLPNSPELSVTFGIEYLWDFDRWGMFTPRFQLFYQDESFFAIENFDEGKNKPTTLLDLKFTWESPNKHYVAEAFVNNLTDKDLIRRIDVTRPFGGGGSVQLVQQFTSPRTAGLRFGMRY